MTLLILELLGDATTAAEATYTIGTDIAFTTATLRAIDVHAPGAMLTELWNKAQTGDRAIPVMLKTYHLISVITSNLSDTGLQSHSCGRFPS